MGLQIYRYMKLKTIEESSKKDAANRFKEYLTFFILPTQSIDICILINGKR